MLTCGSSLTAKLLDWPQNLADRPRFSPQQRLIPRIEASPQITLMAGFHQDRCRGSRRLAFAPASLSGRNQTSRSFRGWRHPI